MQQACPSSVRAPVCVSFTHLLLTRTCAGADVLRELTATRGVCGRLSSAGQAVDACLGALDLCSRARLALERGQYYASLRLLERVRLQKLPLLAGVPPLRQYFLVNLPLAEAAVEDGAKALLDAWLVDAAAAAPRIGRAAVAAAAEERTAVDARWDAQLAGVRACSGPGALGQDGRALFQLTLASSQSGGDAEAEADPLQGLTLGPVATARHALAVLAKEDAFWQHYSEARAQQLSALLIAASGAGSATFLEQYQPLLSAVAGFFVTEGHVERASGGGLSHIQVASSWDRASGALAEAIATHLGACTSAAQALLVAHYVRLLTVALRRQGLWTAALDAALADAQDAFHAASHGEALADVRQALKADAALAPLVLHNAGEYARDVVALGLHPRGAEVPSAADDFPLQAPFTSLVPATLRCLHTAAADSAAFCGARGEEGLRSCCRTTDVLLRNLLDSALMPHLQAAAQRGFDPLLQVTANAAALDAGVDALDGATAEACHMASERATALALAHLAVEGAQAGRPRVLGQFRDAAEEALLAALSSQVESFFVVAPLEEWLPEQPRSLPREAAHATAAFLEHALGQACEVLAPATAARLARAAAGRAADCLVNPITRTGDTGRRFNVHSLTGLEADVELLQRMTAHLPVAGLDSCFAEPKQLCSLFSGVSLDVLAGPACESPAAFRAALQKDFFALAPSRLALLLDRYREPPAPGLLHRQAAQPPSLFPKRKAAAVVLDRVNTSILKR